MVFEDEVRDTNFNQDVTVFQMDIISTGTAPTKGTVAYDQGTFRKSGRFMELQWSYNQTGGGAAGTGTYRFKIPGNYKMDNNFIPFQGIEGTFLGIVGDANAALGTSSGRTGTVYARDSTTLLIVVSDHLVGPGFVTASSFALNNTNVRYSINCRVPIVGWR